MQKPEEAKMIIPTFPFFNENNHFSEKNERIQELIKKQAHNRRELPLQKKVGS